MDIYVQSRTRNIDYYWVRQSTEQKKVHNVPRIIQSVTKFNEDKDLKLIHESEPSIVLLRSQDELLLLVSGLRTKRQDKDRRYIRNSIAWIAPNKDEPILRSLAALVLKSNLQILENLVPESSNSSGEFFKVNWQDIDINQLIRPSIIDSSFPPENGEIALFSEQRTQELADQLIKYALPERDGALVVVTTGFKPKAIFVRADVWRGLSSDISISPEWHELHSIQDSSHLAQNKHTNDNKGNNLSYRAVNNIPQIPLKNIQEFRKDLWFYLKKYALVFFMLIPMMFFVLNKR